MTSASWTSTIDDRPREWAAEWVWSDRPALVAPGTGTPFGGLDPTRFDQRVLFRATFSLETVPTDAELVLTADSRYIAWVNGREVGRGPVRHGRRQLHHDTIPVAALLEPGENTVAVLARFYGYPVPWWEPSPASFTMGGGSLVAELIGNGEVLTASGPEWRAREALGWTPRAPVGTLVSQIPEQFDARTADHGWQLPGYDDADWPMAVVQGEHAVIGPAGRTRPNTDPYGAVVPRPIPLLSNSSREPADIAWYPALAGSGAATDASALDGALRLVSSADPSATSTRTSPSGRAVAVVDFGAIVSGVIELSIEASAGDVVHGALLEVLAPAALESCAAVTLTLRDGITEWASSDTAGGRYLLLAIDAAASPTLRSIAVRELRRPRTDLAAFRSSDAELDRIVAVGLRTVDLTAHDAYVDCPTREQRAWTGDAVVHQSVDLVTNADWSLAAWSPQLLAQARPDGILPMAAAGDFASSEVPTIPDWSLHWMHSVHTLAQYTGDRELVRSLLGTAEGVLRWFIPFQRADGLLHNVTGWVLIDWSPVQVAGSSAALTALWARGLLEFAELARWLGDTGRAGWAEALHARIAAGFDAYWDESRGAYRDNLVDGRLGTSVSEHTAAAAILAGLVREQRMPRVRDLLLDRTVMFTASPLSDHGSDQLGPTAGSPVSERSEPDWDTESLVIGAQPFFRSVVHDAIARLGGQDELMRLYADWIPLVESGPTALRECWEGGSFAHGWSATPTRDVLVHTLGISPAVPGYGRVRIAPRLGGLAWASGEVPTPHGTVTVEVHGDAVSVESPVPIEFVARTGPPIMLPAGRHRRSVTDGAALRTEVPA